MIDTRDHKKLFLLVGVFAVFLLVYYYSETRDNKWIEGIAHIEASEIKSLKIKIEGSSLCWGKEFMLDKNHYPSFLQALKNFRLLNDERVQLLVSETYVVTINLSSGEERQFVVLRSGKFRGGVMEILRSNIIVAKSHNDDLLNYIHALCKIRRENRGKGNEF